MKMNKQHVFLKSFAAVAILIVGGCSSLIDLSSGPAPAHYVLNPMDKFPAMEAAMPPVTILVDEPGVPGGLRSERIPVRTSDNEIAFFGGARWADRVPLLIHNYVLESLENSGRVTVVGYTEIEIPSDYRLKLDLRDFHADFRTSTDRGEAVVRLKARLVRQGPVEIVAEETFEASVGFSGNQAAGAVSAFDDAMAEVTTDLVLWLDKVFGEEG